jgi:predicted porin
VVNAGLFSRNSYIGLANPAIGAIKIGKSDAPYKNSTAAFNPFSGEWGDYAVVMGNTGGDNRVEFGTRVNHAIWYESPNWGGYQFNVMYAPGQNRSWASDNIAAGEGDCTGGNDPTTGGDNPPLCNDGSFSDLISANLSYTNGSFYITAAGEWHHAVNRSSDISTGIYGINNPLIPSTVNNFASNCPTTLCQTLFNQDEEADEWAAKIGALYKFESWGTTVGAIVEYMRREVPADLAFQNERTRWGTWAFLSQVLTPVDSVHFGWAHAFRTPGDPGQHNDTTISLNDPGCVGSKGPTGNVCTDGQLQPGTGGTTGNPAVFNTNGAFPGFATNQNQADMVTAAYKHQFSKNLTWYTDIAATFNGPSAHYDLGAGGRGVTTDCHDATGASGGAFGNPKCFTGTTIVGVSTGIQWRF